MKCPEDLSTKAATRPGLSQPRDALDSRLYLRPRYYFCSTIIVRSCPLVLLFRILISSAKSKDNSASHLEALQDFPPTRAAVFSTAKMESTTTTVAIYTLAYTSHTSALFDTSQISRALIETALPPSAEAQSSTTQAFTTALEDNHDVLTKRHQQAGLAEGARWEEDMAQNAEPIVRGTNLGPPLNPSCSCNVM